jgi:hypothetical protein
MPNISLKRSLKQSPQKMSELSQNPARQKTVAIISKPDRPELSEVLPALEKWLQERNYTVVVDQESAAYFSASAVMPRSELDTRCQTWPGTRWRWHLASRRAVSKVGTLISASTSAPSVHDRTSAS